MIIVEGPDHVGKTTFCEKIMDNMPGGIRSYSHMIKPGPEWDYYLDYIRQLKSGRVYDRFHFGAFVYGAMLNLHKTPGWSLWRMTLVTQFIHVAKGLVIVMYDSDEQNYKHRLQTSKRKEMFNLGPIVEANHLFQITPDLNEVDYVFDVKGGREFPTDADAQRVVDAWRLNNGL